MSTPRLTIQVVLWNSARTLPELLHSLQQQTYRDAHIVFIDNHSEDGSVELVRTAFPDATIIQNQGNKGFSAAHNQGLRMHATEFSALVNPDIVIPEGIFERLIAEFDARPDLGSIGTKLLRKGEESGIVDTAGILATRYREFLNRGEGERDQGQYNTAQEVFGINGAFIVLRRTALESVRFGQEFLDEDLFAYKDDIDLAWRLRIAGWKNWYLPEPAALHVRTVRHEADRSVFSRRGRKQAVINQLSYRNHSIILLKNDRLIGWLFPWPRILLYEIAKFVYILFFEPTTLRAVPAYLRMIPRTLRKRRALQSQRRAHAREIEQWFV